MSSTTLYRPETEIARRKPARSGPAAVSTSLGTISLRLVSDLPSLKGLWEAMQSTAPCTAAQAYDWAHAWAGDVLAPQGREAAIIVGYGASGAPLFLWPFEQSSELGLPILKWLGQDHANYNMGLFTPEAAQGLASADMSGLLKEAARQAGAAAAILIAQPFIWDGIANPFAKLRHQLSPNRGYAVKLDNFAELYERRFSKRSRGTLDRKERRLREMGTLRFGWSETQDETRALLDVFFAQKAKQFAVMGVHDVFDAPARAFYRDVALLERNNPSRLRLGYLKLDEAVLATFSGTVCHDRMIVALSSLAEGDVQRQSPGALLLRHQIEEASAQGLAFYDLGVGQAHHKDEWCDVVQDLFDSFIAFKPQGLVGALPLAAAARLKRTIKSNRHLWSFAQQVRKSLLGRGEEAGPSNRGAAAE
ncbi:MAG: GNAT family N-acetyltransferase [Methyloceanibacter sp.]|uniref:GNAT family N-acetyltransferase n=1 Tax=Methyloceanibacter sp. TaxID=1965321 RepID=UPI003D6D398D